MEKTILEKLQSLQEALGTEEAVAMAVGVSFPTVRTWLHCGQLPSRWNQVRIDKAYNSLKKEKKQ